MIQAPKLFSAACLLFAASSLAHATPVDLTGWTSPGGGSWNVQPGNDSVLQSINGNPTFFYEAGTSAQGLALSGTIRVLTSSDDDYIGFGLGFESSDVNSTSADYILIDWKQGNQSGASEGLAISHVSDSTNVGDFWLHNGGVNEIQRGATLGSTGWVDFQEYDFDLQFTSSLIEVSVDGSVELSITPVMAGLTSFNDGSFAFYNYSQSSVLYGAITEDQTTLPVPDGGTSALLLALGFLPIAIKCRLAKAGRRG